MLSSGVSAAPIDESSAELMSSFGALRCLEYEGEQPPKRMNFS